MTVFSIIAAAYTFTAVATGLDDGAPVEFMFAGNGSDHDYESLFLVEKGIGEICKDLETAGLPIGKPVDLSKCHVWPVGCPVKVVPSLSNFLTIELPQGLEPCEMIYTGGTRDTSGMPTASTNTPMALMTLYSLSQSPFVFNGIYEQGIVYNSFKAKRKLKKGEKVEFTISWNDSEFPKSVAYELNSGNTKQIFEELKRLSEKTEVDVQVSFDPEITVEEAVGISQALAMIDSRNVKINGRKDGSLFYRAFLPLQKWLDRKERLVQPFELTLGTPDRLVFLEEDWSGEGIDPKLTERQIKFDDAVKYERTDTCFIFAEKTMTISRVESTMRKVASKNIRNWYVFAK